MKDLTTLARAFLSLSLLTLGGGMAVFPELKSRAVDVHGWLTAPQLDYLYSVGQLAPGPNMLMIASIGERVAGAAGALVTVLAFLAPTAVLVFVAGRFWTKLKASPWMAVVERGLRPVAIGLLLAGCVTFSQSVLTDWATVLIALVTFVLALRTDVNPAFLVFGGAIVGLIVSGRR